MKVAVLTLTRERLRYTQQCFTSLRAYAGCQYDHYVLDQGSHDGTAKWLAHQGLALVVLLDENVGIHRGHNRLLALALERDEYDVVCTYDNDCLLRQPGTLQAAARVAMSGEWIVSPRVLGLNYPPVPGEEYTAYGERIGLYWEIGGICRVMPGSFAREFRFDESRPYWGKDEVDVGAAARARGLRVGYLLDWEVEHYRTTQGQQQDYPAYFERKFAEMR